MNNASTSGNQGGQSAAYSKKLYLLFKHMAIPATTIFVAAGIILGFITAVHWSVLVTGTSEYTGYIFRKMSSGMMLIVFGSSSD